MSEKVALVTGAAAGIGTAICRQLARDGIAVGVSDINYEDAKKVADSIVAEGGKAIALECNVADRENVKAAVNELRSAFGAITILVNNAGIPGITPFEEITDEMWDRQMEVNLKGTFIPTQVVLPDMKAAKWGRVVNISSSGAQSGCPHMAHYTAAKGGVISFTRTLALELGPLGITVNNVPPASVMNTVMSEANKKKFPIHPDDLKKMLPVRRTGEPEDIANAVSWLVKEETGYVTGQTIGVNGGRVVS